MKSQRSLSSYVLKSNQNSQKAIRPLVNITQKLVPKKLVVIKKQEELKNIYNSQRSLVSKQDMKSVSIIKDIQFSNKTLLKQIDELKFLNSDLQKHIDSIHQTYKNSKIVELLSQINHLEDQIQKYQIKVKYLENLQTDHNNKKILDDNFKLSTQIKKLKQENIEIKSKEQARNYNILGVKQYDENLKTQMQYYKDKIIDQDFQLNLISEQNLQLLQDIDIQNNQIDQQQKKINSQQQQIHILNLQINKFESQIKEYQHQEELSNNEKLQLQRDMKFLQSFVTQQKGNSDIEQRLNNFHGNAGDLMLFKQQKKTRVIIKQDVQNLFQQINYTLRLSQIEFQYIYDNYFKQNLCLSIQELISILQGDIFKIKEQSDALMIARYLVEVNKPITNIHQKHDPIMIWSILKKNIGDLIILTKQQQIQIIIDISHKIRPKKQYIENWIIDISKKCEEQGKGIITWELFNKILVLQQIHISKDELNLIELINYENSQLIDKINIKIFLQIIFQHDLCNECESFQQLQNDCECLPRKFHKSFRQSFQKICLGINQMIKIKRQVKYRKQKSKEV